MLKLTDRLDPSSKIFTFLAGKELTEENVKVIESELKNFMGQWKSHGQAVKADFEVYKKFFIVIGVDLSVTTPSGCSIDSLTQLIKEIGNIINVEFFDNFNIAVLDENDNIKIINFKNIKQAISDEEITYNTKIFTIIKNASDIESHWIVEAGNSWLKRYFNKQAVTNSNII